AAQASFFFGELSLIFQGLSGVTRCNPAKIEKNEIMNSILAHLCVRKHSRRWRSCANRGGTS
ncbi:hypothetical protein, partial [Phaeobacter gallaeciensis]|uniref:hypothetical protein n=1 Tax=Phaeobacter gallaeciensis TaxID=60890 RepID=UPI00237F97F7